MALILQGTLVDGLAAILLSPLGFLRYTRKKFPFQKMACNPPVSFARSLDFGCSAKLSWEHDVERCTICIVSTRIYTERRIPERRTEEH
ncbi:hypothetical protein CPC08DRAFT_524911 [Agrocybe pediades]|nr:hypothetical protein CPC08DRAFT_524911 [Agrocybe pediades]